MSNSMKNEYESGPGFLVRTKSLREILSDLRKAELWLIVAALAAFLASAFFVVKYFVGGEMTPQSWDGEQWFNAFLGLGLTAVITAAQAFLYATGQKGAGAGIGIFIVVFFGLFSEVSQSMERADVTVRHRSENSEVFKAALGSISALSTAPTISGAASSELARAQQKAAQIQTRIDNKNRCASCEQETFRNLRAMLADAKGRVAAAKARVDMEMQSFSSANAAALQSAIITAKQLEYDEDKHYAMIRLIKSLFGITADWASFVFSMIIICTFEYAFFYVGRYVADHKQALKLMGRDAYGRRLSNPDPITEDSVSADNDSVYRETSKPQKTRWWNMNVSSFLTSLLSSGTLEQGGSKPIPQDTKPQKKSTDNPQKGKGTDVIVSDDAFLAVVESIKTGEIMSVNASHDTPFGKLAGKFTSMSNGELERKYIPALLDMLWKEQWIIKNPNKGNAANRPQYCINQPKFEKSRTGQENYVGTQAHDFLQSKIDPMIVKDKLKPNAADIEKQVAHILKQNKAPFGLMPFMSKSQRMQIAQSIANQHQREITNSVPA